MKLQLLENKLPKLPKERKSPINSIYILGKLIIFKLPKSYLSYLKRNFSFQVGLVSTGKYQVSTQTPINKGFGKIGKIFYIFLSLQILFSCQNSTDLESDNPENFQKKNKNISSKLAPGFGYSNGTTIGTGISTLPQLGIIHYIRYNVQDDEFSIDGGPWFTNPYPYTDGDTEFIFAIPRQNCKYEFHSGIYKISNVIPLQVPAGINVSYSNLSAETILFNNPGCTYFVSTDIVHFKATFTLY